MFKRFFATNNCNDNAIDIDVTNVTSDVASTTFINAVQDALANDKYTLPRKTESKLFLDCTNVDVVSNGLKSLVEFTGPGREFVFYVTDGTKTCKYSYRNGIIVAIAPKHYSKTMTAMSRESYTQIALGDPCATVTLEQLVAPNNQLFVHTEHFKQLHRKNMYKFKILEAFRWYKIVDYTRLDFRQMFLDVFKHDDDTFITVCDYILVNPINMSAFIARDSVELSQCVTPEFLFVRAILIREFIKYYTINDKPKYRDSEKYYFNDCGTVTTGKYVVNMHSDEKLMNLIHRNVPYC